MDVARGSNPLFKPPVTFNNRPYSYTNKGGIYGKGELQYETPLPL